MKYLKRIAIMSLCLVSMFILTACGKDNNKEFTLGAVENNVYKNDYFNLEIPVINNWFAYTEDELKNLWADTTDLTKELSDNKIDLSKYDVIIPFAMRSEEDINSETNSSLNVTIEKASSLASKVTSAKTYAENGIETMKANGYDVFDFSDIKETKIGDKTFYYYDLTTSVLPDFKVSQYVTKAGDYYMVITINSMTAEGEAQLADVLKKIKIK